MNDHSIGRDSALDGLPTPSRYAGRKRILRQRVLDVGEDQLLMLLFVIEPELDHGRDGLREPIPGRLEIVLQRPIDGRAIGVDLLQAGPSDQAASGPGQAVADGIVVGIEEIAKRRMKHL